MGIVPSREETQVATVHHDRKDEDECCDKRLRHYDEQKASRGCGPAWDRQVREEPYSDDGSYQDEKAEHDEDVHD